MAEIARRVQSRPAQHRDYAITPCQWPVELRFESSARHKWEFLALIRCLRCDAEALIADHVARAVEVRGVLFDPQPIEDDDEYNRRTNWGTF